MGLGGEISWRLFHLRSLLTGQDRQPREHAHGVNQPRLLVPGCTTLLGTMASARANPRDWAVVASKFIVARLAAHGGRQERQYAVHGLVD